jgi:predicted Zn-ribbon and HTH transcriptional regulator
MPSRELEAEKAKVCKQIKYKLDGLPKKFLVERLARVQIVTCPTCNVEFVSEDINSNRYCNKCKHCRIQNGRFEDFILGQTTRSDGRTPIVRRRRHASSE